MKLSREQFIRDARQLIADRVPFRHGGRDPYDGGLDCLYSAIYLAHRQGKELPPEMENISPYLPDVHRCDEIEAVIRRYLIEVSPEETKGGDLFLFRTSRKTRHIGIQISDDSRTPLLFHMLRRPHNRAVEMTLDPSWRDRIIGVFRFPDFVEEVS